MRKVKAIKNKIGFKPLSKKYKRMRELKITSNVNPKRMAYVAVLFARKTDTMNRKTKVSLERGSSRWTNDVPGMKRPKIIFSNMWAHLLPKRLVRWPVQ